MHKTLLISLSGLFTVLTLPVHAQRIIVDHHDVALFDSIPDEYKQAAAATRMLFMDRSVGFNISTYLDCMSQPWDDAPNSCKRYTHQDSIYAVDPTEVHWNGTWDRSNWHYAFWPAGCSEDVTCFLDYMDADGRLDSFDVFGVQFSYLAVTPGSIIADPVNGFFGSSGSDNKASTYAAYAAAHPDKKLVWWTTSLARGIGTPESESFNDQMRDYAASHDIILFDVADILAHDPSGNPCYDNRDGVAYKDENHPDDGLDIPAICPQYTTETDGGHLGAISAGGIRVVKAFWVLMARIAGWQEMITPVFTPDPFFFRISPNPATGNVRIQFHPSTDATSLRVLDNTGRLIMEHTIMGGTSEYTFSVRDIVPGIYFVQMNEGDNSVSQKLVVK